MIVAVLLVSFFMLSLGALLIGIACVKDAFTPTVVRRVEAGSAAVQETTRGKADRFSGSLRFDTPEIKAPTHIGRV